MTLSIDNVILKPLEQKRTCIGCIFYGTYTAIRSQPQKHASIKENGSSNESHDGLSLLATISGKICEREVP